MRGAGHRRELVHDGLELARSMDMVRLVNGQKRERGVRVPTKRLADDNDAVLEVDGYAPKPVVERREQHEETRLDQAGG